MDSTSIYVGGATSYPGAGTIGSRTLFVNLTPSWMESVNSSTTTGDIDTSYTPMYWSLVLSFIPILTVFGNVLVVLSVYRERTLRSPTNYFIVSLAVSDIMVAALVMPLSVYVTVSCPCNPAAQTRATFCDQKWLLGDLLCDTWVAFDVMCCTASILNLMAISMDRFIAVTQPLTYSKYKNTKRHYLMIFSVWFISVAISAPIIKMNYTEQRQLTPLQCIFYNSDFLIYSSMGSFYIPCLVMIFLYWKIFKVIHERARRKARAKKKRQLTCSGGGATQTTTIGTQHPYTENMSCHRDEDDRNQTDMQLLQVRETSLRNHSAKVTVTDTDDEFVINQQCGSTSGPPHRVKPVDAGGHNSSEVALITEPEASVTPPSSTSSRKINQQGTHIPSSPSNKLTGKFNFRLRPNNSKKKKNRSANKRERKATKTLAIVLGVFLICWMPFFTINIINAVCIRYNTMHRPICSIDPVLFTFFVWLGYINSFMNPVIYTIFNIEFRRAFKKLLGCP